MPSLGPKPGFPWWAVQWGGPDDPVSYDCSLCGAAITEDGVPLRLWDEYSGRAAVFCDACMQHWWGFSPTPWEDDDA